MRLITIIITSIKLSIFIKYYKTGGAYIIKIKNRLIN
jgi:hypothetical protein